MRACLLIAALAAATPLAAREPPPPPGLRVDRVVVVMRHGVRPPTKSPPMPAGYASGTWPGWPVKPGYLTPHGAQAVELAARYDRATWIVAGLLPHKRCARLRVVADSDQRTIATAEHYAAALAPGCRVTIEHKPEGVPDPLFSPIEQKAVPFDAEAARAAVLADAGPDGIAAAERRLRPLLARLDAILCGPGPAGSCGVAREPTTLAPARPGEEPELTGALDRGSTAAQILLLQYAQGKPMAEVGWGRATAADVTALSELHAAEFRLLARPRYMAKANLALIAPLLAASLADTDAAPVTIVSGHDTDVASLGGMLGLHWQVPGFAADDPAPGGAIILQRLRDRAGRLYVRALYRAQTLGQIRALTRPERTAPYVAVLPIAGCRALGQAGLCTAADFAAALRR